ncbi:MAG: phosphoglycolate phosphatase [Rhodobacteraceae bacterium]|nr:phosphoglycolate phosphatase [Paracoccaceae bacterium]
MTTIVFDLDGTLIDSAPDLRAAANRMLEDEGLEPLDLPTIISFIGNGLPRLTHLAMQARGLDMARQDELTEQVIGHYSSGNGALTTLYPGVMDVLNTLKEQGHSLGLCTNKPIAATHEVLGQFALTEIFSAVFGGDSLEQRKPHPAPLLATFDALGSGGIYVGDSEVDAETAQRANVPFALFTEGYRKTPAALLPHEWSFSEFSALPAIVESVKVLSA